MALIYSVLYILLITLFVPHLNEAKSNQSFFGRFMPRTVFAEVQKEVLNYFIDNYLNLAVNSSKLADNRLEEVADPYVDILTTETPVTQPYASDVELASSRNSTVQRATFCENMSNAFTSYARINWFLVLAFFLMPITVPIYAFGFFSLLLLRATACGIGGTNSGKQILGNMVSALTFFRK